VIAVILIGIGCAYLGNELCEFSPWCARKLARWSAFRRYADPGRAEMRAEELAAVINARPGNLLKLITAAGFAGAAVIVSARRAVAQESAAAVGSGSAPPVLSHAEALDRVYGYLEGELDEATCAKIRQHLDECGPCLHEYGLEEVVRRVVQKHCPDDPQPLVLRAKILTRIREIRATID
jgi:mycothiol system anti-sigma-R factor